MNHTLDTVIDADNYFLIDPITKTITNQTAAKNSLVQYEHNSEVFTFKIPRMVEGHDMLCCDKIQVHYINKGQAGNNPGLYESKDAKTIVEDDSEFVVFSWLISQNATLFTGDISFQIKFVCYRKDEPTKPDYIWSTKLFSAINVLPGINNADVIVEENADVLAMWEQKLFGLSEQGVENINTAKKVALNEIEAAGRLQSQLANALKGDVYGEAVALTDVSPIGHTVGVKVQTKNIYPYKQQRTVYNGTILEYGDNYIVVKGYDGDGAYAYSSGWYYFYRYNQLVSEGGKINFTKDTLVTVSMEITLIEEGMNGVNFRFAPWAATGQAQFTATTTPTRYSFTVKASDLNNTGDGFYVSLGGNTLKIANVQFEYGEVATEYTPYMKDVSDTVVEVVDDNGRFEEFRPNADGVVEGVTSSYPSMTIRSTRSETVVDVTYNRDINKAYLELEQKLRDIETNLTNAIISTGGNV